MQALIDGDIIRYRCGFAVEHSRYNIYLKGEEMFGPIAVYPYKRDIPWYYKEDPECSIEKETDVEPLANCLQAVKTTIEAILRETNATSYRLFLSGDNNFREKVSVTRVYKGNRDALHKPKWYNEIKEYLIRQWKAEVINGMEADDAMGIEQIKNYEDDDTQLYQACGSIICSLDKDMDMIMGWHYNFVKKLKYWIDEDTAIKNFYTQLLTGDVVDNIQGITGMGIKGAAKAFAGCVTEEEYYSKAISEYKKVYGDRGEEMLNEMAQLLWIRREHDVGFVVP